MAFPKNSRSALLALAAASGAWAWQNRHKLSGMLTQARNQIDSSQASYRKPAVDQQHAPSVEAYTGNTRRIGDEANEI